ncbi:MAG: endolytic transglycosylase MltG [Paludibacteraceae bacterium]|nr:endolytic transglycosylase MltG [Paludibacteraceae bacterium]
MKKRYIIRTVLIVLGVLIIIGGSFALEQYYRLQVSNFRSRDGEEHSYNIYPGATVDSVLALLDSDYYIGSKPDFYLHKRMLLFNNPEPGRYVFPPQFGDREVIDRLKFGRQTPVKVTWNNYVRTREELAGKVTRHLMIDSLTLLQLLDSNEYMAQFGLNKETSRCLFIPNTYQIMWNITPDKLFARMNYEYNVFWTEQRRRKADSLGLTPVEVAIIASIVEGESHNPKELPIIASLYLNRVRKGMHLQACPTVKYAVGDFKLRRILNRHLAVDNPYNTYKYPGLPPGPIRCPLAETMDIVLNAPKTDVLYMCANPALNNTHIFSSSYSGHAAAAKQYRHTMDTINWERFDEMRRRQREEAKLQAQQQAKQQ